MIYSIWIFNRHCNCVYNQEWTLAGGKTSIINNKQNDETGKLLYGLIYSLRSISDKLAQDNQVHTISMGKFRVHLYETATGHWFVLLTDFVQDDYKPVLQYIYTNIYCKYVVNNLLSPYDYSWNATEQRGQGSKRITNRKFISTLEQFLRPML